MAKKVAGIGVTKGLQPQNVPQDFLVTEKAEIEKEANGLLPGVHSADRSIFSMPVLLPVGTWIE
jgi:hypothetical protein